jgi:hypothetical protein
VTAVSGSRVVRHGSDCTPSALRSAIAADRFPAIDELQHGFSHDCGAAAPQFGRIPSPKEGLIKSLAQGRGSLAVVHPPQYGVIGACWCRFGRSAPLIGRVADTLRRLAAQ